MSQKLELLKRCAKIIRTLMPRKRQHHEVEHQIPTFVERLLIQQAKWPRGERRMIELVGGPLDGHTECIDANEVHPISSQVAFVIGPEIFRFLEGHQRTYGHTTKTCAIYELLLEDDRWLYRFIRQVAHSGSQQETRL